MSLSETVLLRACSGKKWENALGQTAGVEDGEGEEEADQEEEVGGVKKSLGDTRPTNKTEQSAR